MSNALRLNMENSGSTGKTNKRKVENPTAPTGEDPTGPSQRPWCRVHPQVPPLFCQDDGQCFCVACDISVHKFHTILSEEEAENRLKAPLRSQLKTLQQQRQSCEERQQKYDKIQNQSEEQVQHCECQISAVFSRMRRHLQEEEDTALRALRQEQDRQSHLLKSLRKTLTEKLSPVNNSIQQLEKYLQTPTREFFLMLRPAAGPSGGPLSTGLLLDQAIAPLPTGLLLDQAIAPLPTGLMLDQAIATFPTGLMLDQAIAPLSTGLMLDQAIAPLPTGLMLDQAKVLRNLDFRVWRSFKSAVQYKPIILDPNTAHTCLHLSEDLSGATCGDTYQDHLPDIPERFSENANVLGSEGFSSGTHQWDVEVGDHPLWVIGVAKESVDRKGKRPGSPENGIWSLFHKDGKYKNCYGELLTVKKSPEKITVRLDYDGGAVSFYDTDPMTLLYTSRHTFTEKMFPFFSIGESKEAKTKEIRITETPDEE